MYEKEYRCTNIEIILTIANIETANGSKQKSQLTAKSLTWIHEPNKTRYEVFKVKTVKNNFIFKITVNNILYNVI